MDGSEALVEQRAGDRDQGWRRGGCREIEMPKACCRGVDAGEEQFVMEVNLDAVGVERDSTPSDTELPQ
jgi:hypothetical protein